MFNLACFSFIKYVQQIVRLTQPESRARGLRDLPPQDTERGAEGGEWASVASGQQSEPHSEQVTEEPGFGPGAHDIEAGRGNKNTPTPTRVGSRSYGNVKEEN